MSFMLDESSPLPLYRQVRTAIEKAVADGQYRNLPLPSSRALAAELGISRTTVNLAYQELVAEGFVYAQPRSGFRVNAELVAQLAERSPGNWPHPVSTGSAVDWDHELRQSGGTFPEIAKDLRWSEYRYPFVYGQVSTSMFPATAWNRALRDAMDTPNAQFCLRDAGSDDDPLLIDQLCRSVLTQRGIKARREQVLITLGTQHGLFLASRVLARPADTVIVENPGYPDAATIFERAGTRVVPVPVDGSGLMTARLPRDARIIYVTPSHQFPTNTSLTIARRVQLAEHCTQGNAFIIEDDYDSEFRYVGRPAPALRSQAGPRVIYLGSFSKFLAPGLRLGYVVAEPEVIAQMRIDRRYSVRHPPGHIQRAMALLIASGDYHRALRRNRSALREKWRAATTGVRQTLGWKSDVPTGGTSLWLKLPSGIDSDTLTSAAARHSIFIESGSTFFLSEPRCNDYIRLGFAAIPLNRIDAGLKRLGEVARALT